MLSQDPNWWCFFANAAYPRVTESPIIRHFLTDLLCVLCDLVFMGVWMSGSDDVEDDTDGAVDDEYCGEFGGVGAAVSAAGDEVSFGWSMAVGEPR